MTGAAGANGGQGDEVERLRAENERLRRLYGDALECVVACTDELFRHFDLGYIAMPMGPVQALAETVSMITKRQYDYDPWRFL